MNPYQKDVEAFHEAMGMEVGLTPEMRSSLLRAKLIVEEAVETAAAMGFGVAASIYTPGGDAIIDAIETFEKEYFKPNFEDMIDGLCDLLYVTFGAAVTDGLDLDPFFAEVHKANMLKSTGPKRADGKQLKPEGWQPPDHGPILERQIANAQTMRDAIQDAFEDGIISQANAA